MYNISVFLSGLQPVNNYESHDCAQHSGGGLDGSGAVREQFPKRAEHEPEYHKVSSAGVEVEKPLKHLSCQEYADCGSCRKRNKSQQLKFSELFHNIIVNPEHKQKVRRAYPREHQRRRKQKSAEKLHYHRSESGGVRREYPFGEH